MDTDTTIDLYRAGVELEHGWQPDTPATDTTHRQSVLALAASTAVPSIAMGARSLHDSDLVATNLGPPAGFWNAAVITRPLDEPGWQRVLRAVSALEGSIDGDGTVDLWSPFPTPDLHDRGWDLAGHPVAMWRPGTGTPERGGSKLRVERVVDREGVAEWADAAVAFYPLEADPAVVASPGLLARPDIHLLIGRIGDRPVAASATVVAHGTNAVAFIATDPHERRLGHGRAITAAATSVRPDLPAVLLASDDGRPLYEHMGYQPHTRWTMWIRPTR